LQDGGIDLTFQAGFVRLFNNSIASHAACERLDLAGQVQFPHNLGQLILRVVMPEPVAVRDAVVFQYLPAAGEDNTFFP